jgi:hypothetical protein
MIIYNSARVGLQVLSGQHLRRRDSVVEKTQRTDMAMMGMSACLNAWKDSMVQVLDVCCHATNS